MARCGAPLSGESSMLSKAVWEAKYLRFHIVNEGLLGVRFTTSCVCDVCVSGGGAGFSGWVCVECGYFVSGRSRAVRTRGFESW